MSTGAVVVVSYGSAALLAENLLPLARQAPHLRVVVVDSWSGQAERERVRALAAQHGWVLVAPGENTGFGAGADLGIDAARGAGCDAVVLLNPDARVDGAVVDALLAAVREDHDLLLSPRVVHPDGAPWFVGGRLDLRTGRTSTRGGRVRGAREGSEVAWLSGACLAAPVDGWRRLGGFDPRFFLYWEDVELSLRWRRLGGRTAVRPDLVAVHDVGGTQAGTGGKTALYVRWNCRNRLLLAGMLGPGTFLRWTWLAPSYGWEVVRRGGRRRLLRQPGLLVAALVGTVAGVVAGARAALVRTGPRTTRSAGTGGTSGAVTGTAGGSPAGSPGRGDARR